MANDNTEQNNYTPEQLHDMGKQFHDIMLGKSVELIMDVLMLALINVIGSAPDLSVAEQHLMLANFAADAHAEMTARQDAADATKH
jgi:hypothetical protein